MKSVRGVAQLASALAWGARGRKFESFRPDREKDLTSSNPFFYTLWSRGVDTKAFLFPRPALGGWGMPPSRVQSAEGESSLDVNNHPLSPHFKTCTEGFVQRAFP